MQKIVVTGMGIISSIGNSVEENFHSLIHSKSGITRVENFSTYLKDFIKVGEIKLSNEDLSERLNIVKENSYTRTSLLAIFAIKEAIKHFSETEISQMGLVSASTVGGMDKTEQYFYEYQNNISVRKYIHTHNIGDITHQIADYFGLKSIVTALSTACSSSANAIITGCNLLRMGYLKQVIVGGSDPLSKFTINGFNSLMILSDTDCQPFDNNRKGLNLGEAGAYLVLETEENALKNNHKIIGLPFFNGKGTKLKEFSEAVNKLLEKI